MKIGKQKDGKYENYDNYSGIIVFVCFLRSDVPITDATCFPIDMKRVAIKGVLCK